MSTLNSLQAEQLQEIGAYLRQIREEQCRSLEDIATHTYIPLRLLKAIESGQSQPLPEAVFVRGFIRRYADALGLNGVELSQRFSLNSAVAVQEPPLSAPPSSPPAPSRRSPQWQMPQIPRQAIYIPYVIGGAVLVGGLVYGISQGIQGIQRSNTERSQPQPTLAETPAPVDTESPPVTASPSPIPSPTVAASPSPTPSAPIQVVANITGDAWMEVQADGEVKFEGVLTNGTEQTWTAQETLIVRSGNAGAVRLSVNGEDAEVMGGLGEVTEVTLTPQSPSDTDPTNAPTPSAAPTPTATPNL